MSRFKYLNKKYETTIVPITPANDPSNVLLGLTVGNAFLLPKFFPIRYAVISLTELNIMGINNK